MTFMPNENATRIVVWDSDNTPLDVFECNWRFSEDGLLTARTQGIILQALELAKRKKCKMTVHDVGTS